MVERRKTELNGEPEREVRIGKQIESVIRLIKTRAKEDLCGASAREFPVRQRAALRTNTKLGVSAC